MASIDLTEYRARRKALLTNIRAARIMQDDWLAHCRARLVATWQAYRA